jgi:hypothetical protein
MFRDDRTGPNTLSRFYSGTWWVLLLRGMALVALGISSSRALATVAGLLFVLQSSDPHGRSRHRTVDPDPGVLLLGMDAGWACSHSRARSS